MKIDFTGFGKIFCLVAAFLVIRIQPSMGAEGFLMTPDGVRLFYEYQKMMPEKEKGTAILLHGWGMSYNEWAGFKEKLQADGWSTVGFDFRGHGASIESSEKKQLDFQEMNSRSQRRKLLIDIQTVTAYLASDKPVWLIGSSIGANYALRYAAKDSRISGVVLIAPGYDTWKILTKDLPGKFGARPMMLIAARNNPWSFRTGEDLKKRAQGPSLFHSMEAGHDIDGIKDKLPLADMILNWMNEQTLNDKAVLEISPLAAIHN